MTAKIYRYPTSIEKVIDYAQDLDSIDSYSNFRENEYLKLPAIPKDIEQVLDELYYREEDDSKGTFPLVVHYIDKPEDLFEAIVGSGGYYGGDYSTTKGNYYIAAPEYGSEITIVPRNLKADAHLILDITDPYKDSISKTEIKKLKEFIKNNNISIKDLPDDVIGLINPDEAKNKRVVEALSKLESYEGHGNLRINSILDGTLPITEFPENLTYVDGDLELAKTEITSLPENLEITGRLDLRYTPIAVLPKGLKVGKTLYLGKTEVTSLPEDLEAKKLDLSDSKIISLPKNLEEIESLDLENTKITSLPENLKKVDYLNLRNTKISSLPESLKEVGYLNLRDTNLKSFPESLKEIKESLNFENTDVPPLPKNLKIGEDLWLKNTKIDTLPAGLKIGGNLLLEKTSLTSLPDDLKVGGYIRIDDKEIDSVEEANKILKQQNSSQREKTRLGIVLSTLVPHLVQESIKRIVKSTLKDYQVLSINNFENTLIFEFQITDTLKTKEDIKRDIAKLKDIFAKSSQIHYSVDIVESIAGDFETYNVRLEITYHK